MPSREKNWALDRLAEAIRRRTGVKNATTASAEPADRNAAGSSDGLRRTRTVIAVALLGLTLNQAAAVATDGDLDPEFGDGGSFALDIGAQISITDTLRDEAGAIFVVGTVQSGTFVYSLLPDGNPNRRFGNEGLVIVRPADVSNSAIDFDQPAAAIDDVGRLVLAAPLRIRANPRFTKLVLWMGRIDALGVIDTTFADSGHLIVDERVMNVGDVLIGASNTHVVGSRGESEAPFVAIVSGDQGNPSIRINQAEDSFYGEAFGALDAEGRVVVVASSHAADGGDVGLYRVLANGLTDPDFTPQPIDIEDVDAPTTVTISPEGKIVIGGLSKRGEENVAVRSALVARLNSDGSRDRSLSGVGWTHLLLPAEALVRGVVVDDDGRMAAIARVLFPSSGSAAARLTRNGSPDNSFGDGGLASFDLGSGFLSDILAEPDGLLVVGFIEDITDDLYVARLLSTPAPEVAFVDDDGLVFEADIEALARAGITLGCNPPVNDRFCPDRPVTRGQMAAFLVRGLGYIDDGGGDLFVDDDGSVFRPDIDRLGAAGVTLGCNPPTNVRFCPDRPVTRAQMAAFLVRALGYTDDGGGDLFGDDGGSVFEVDIDKLGTAGVTLGCNPPRNDRFCPDRPVTRAQMAAFLTRALDL